MSDKEVNVKKRGRPASKKKAASVDERSLAEVAIDQLERDLAPPVDEKPSKENASAVQGNKKKAASTASTDEKPPKDTSVGQKNKKLAALLEEPSIKDVKKRVQREQRQENPETPPSESVESAQNVPVVHDAVPPSPQKKSEIKKGGSQTKAVGKRAAAPPKKVFDELPDLSDAIPSTQVERVLIPTSPQKKPAAGKKNGNKATAALGSREATPELDPLADVGEPPVKSGSETPPKKSVAGKKNGGKTTTAARPNEAESDTLAATSEPEKTSVPPKKMVGPKKTGAKIGKASAVREKTPEPGPLAAIGEPEDNSDSNVPLKKTVAPKKTGAKSATAAVVREKSPEAASVAKDAEPENDDSGIPEKRSRGRPKRNAEAVSAASVEKPAPRAKPTGRGRKAAVAAVAAMHAANDDQSE